MGEFANEGTASTVFSDNSGTGPCYFVSQCSNSIYGNDGHGSVELQFDGVEREMVLPMIYYTRVLPKNIVIKCHRQIELVFIPLLLIHLMSNLSELQIFQKYIIKILK